MIRRRDLLTSTLVLATGGLAGTDFTAAAPAAQAADGPSLLASMVRAYAALSSYEDSGTITRVDGSDSPYQINFSTLYKSQSLFRFAFANPHPYLPLRHIVTQYQVGFDGAAAYFVSTPFEKPSQSVPTQNLSQALARATGISSGAAHNISRLLLRGISGLSIPDLVRARLLDDAKINGVECYAISARHPRSGYEWVLWIQKDTLLIRKLRTPIGAPDGKFSEETHDNIRINQNIDDVRFKIDA